VRKAMTSDIRLRGVQQAIIENHPYRASDEDLPAALFAQGPVDGSIDISAHDMYSPAAGGNSVAKKKQEPTAPKMGRPVLSDDLRRVWRVSATVNRTELEAITAKATKAGKTVSIWLREVALKA